MASEQKKWYIYYHNLMGSWKKSLPSISLFPTEPRKDFKILKSVVGGQDQPEQACEMKTICCL